MTNNWLMFTKKVSVYCGSLKKHMNKGLKIQRFGMLSQAVRTVVIAL
jgi:DNA-binding transcriptional regulator PaaX